MTTRTVLVVDDERNIRRTLDMILSGEGYTVICEEEGEAALKTAKEHSVDAVLLDIVMPGLSGIEVLKALRQERPEAAVIMISGHGTVQDAVQATRLGAYDFLEKPLSREKVLLTVSHALESAVLTQENRNLREQIEGRFEMVGESRAILAIREQIEMVAPTNGRVLILGESGTGKELIARDIHRNSRRADGPFIKVNCAAIPEELIESELFGSDRGAFTGAVKTRDGKFLLADQGTLFLDEIGDMSLSVQAKVLRALEQGEFERVGGSDTIKVDVRVIAATNKDLKGLVERGEFREDLFFRLDVVPVVAPPLRDRRDENDFQAKDLTPDATEALCQYDWPGNIRELKNIVERLSIMVRQNVIDADDLPSMSGPRTLRESDGDSALTIPGIKPGQTLREVREAVERACISQALKHSDWNVTRAARSLGIERTNLHKKMNFYEIHR